MIAAAQVPDGQKLPRAVRWRRDAFQMRALRAFRAVRRLIADKEDTARRP